jgi:hypothetical protein
VAWFDCAVHRPISGGTSGPLTAQRGLVLHHAVATGSLFSTFNNGQVSTQFWVSLSGAIEQYLDSTMSAWATGSNTGNMQFCSVETEGCVAAPHAQPMSDAMVSALATLYREGHERHGWPYQIANSTAANGFGYHRLWSATACPCDVRVNRRADILTLAQGTPAQEEEMLVAFTSTGGGYWLVNSSGAVFAYGDAQYRKGINNSGPGGGSALVAGDHPTSISGKGTDGYLIATAQGNLYAFGSAPFLGKP